MPCAPSSRTCSPRASAAWTSHVVSSRWSRSRIAPGERLPRPAGRPRSSGRPSPASSRFLSGSARAIRSSQDVAVEEVLHPQAEPPCPVAVGRPDATPRRADLAGAQSRLVGDVERHVVRHDHVRAAADPDARDVDPARAEHVELVDERDRIDHHAVADDRGDVRIQDARWRQPQLEDLVAVDHRVAGVVAALVAHDHRDLLGQEIGRLALALVAPLQPDDHGSRHQSRHCREPRIGAWASRRRRPASTRASAPEGA